MKSLGSAGVSPAAPPKAAGITESEWRSRGYLPHRDALGLIQMVNFRLFDSLPRALVEELHRRFPHAGPDRRADAEVYLDAGHGACYLRDPAAASIVEGALLSFDAKRYRLVAWSVMPNHVHVLFEPLPGHTLAAILHSWKSFTSHAVNRMLGRSGTFWEREYFDRCIRDEEHLANAIYYIEEENRSLFSSATRRSAGVSPASAP